MGDIEPEVVKESTPVFKKYACSIGAIIVAILAIVCSLVPKLWVIVAILALVGAIIAFIREKKGSRIPAYIALGLAVAAIVVTLVVAFKK